MIKVTATSNEIRKPLADRTLLESQLPFAALSQLALKDRRATDASYRVHRWWARRPPSVFRGLLLAAALPSDASIDEYWRMFASRVPCQESETVGGVKRFDVSRA